ncbi:septal ring lytic transglycosylase RlpA [Colwellia sp. 75C3]|uniref:septal ring lytic transglycosylase RlpA family protein n=1 Tax=Colwellia sp. 75C3 TaxID=888425 RepID=UPI000C34B823|nr:septal ring lytic transglycosylase RlpA family protein [Colwellia sp. 75C3]PKG82093.1 septal ring lytic transglycosylase RlpA [Colwellia sp. 75C3]
MTKRFTLLCYVLLFSLLSACSSDRYQQKHDSTPTRLPNQAELKDAIARAEPYSRGGNKNYKVFGKPYKVLTSAQGFEQTGTASWYGKKFHGHLTSNGEIYDMYTMSAAHKNLPLPTYLKVTNTANNKSVIVRVNDRGPFHQSRIIDLSYSAAYKLDMLKTGTAHVKITAITDFDKKTGKVIIPVENPVDKSVSSVTSSTATTPANMDNKKQSSAQTTTTMGIATPYIQVFATSKKELAISTANKLKKQYKQQTSYPENQGLYRIQIGPISDLATLNALLLALKENGYPNAYPRTAPR